MSEMQQSHTQTTPISTNALRVLLGLGALSVVAMLVWQAITASGIPSGLPLRASEDYVVRRPAPRSA